jgi:hypothetical protein
MMAERGDQLPVSALPVDGTYPSGAAACEKSNISELVEAWEPDIRIRCGAGQHPPIVAPPQVSSRPKASSDASF